MVRGPRRKLVWTSQTITVTMASGAFSPGVDLLQEIEVAGASKLGATVMRTHLSALVGWGAPPIGNGAFMWLGLKITTAAELATGINIPTAQNLDWLLVRQLLATYSANVIDGYTPLEIDNRSKRKVEEMGQTYGLFLFNPTPVSQTTIFFARTLLALP